MTHENPKIAQPGKTTLRGKDANIKTSTPEPTESVEWWEQFGDCYEYWEPLPESEWDYLYWGVVKEGS